MSDAVFQPSSAKQVFIRPLDKGMVLNQPSQAIPDGAFLYIKNLIAGPEGLTRRPGSGPIGKNQALPYTPSDMIAVWRTDGLQKLVILTRNNLYVLDLATGLAEVLWGYSTGTITISGTSVTGSGTSWLGLDAGGYCQNLMSGDILRTADGEAVIDQVTSNTTLVLKTVGTLVNRTGVSYSTQRTFTPGNASQPSFDMLNNFMMIADGKHPLLKYDPLGGTLGYWTTDTKKKIRQTATVIVNNTPGTVAVAATNLAIVTGTSTTFAVSGALAGDTIEFNFSGFPYTDTIKTVDSATQLTISNPGSLPVGTASSYRILRYGGIDFVPACCCGFAGRAWVGYTVDAVDGQQKQRIRWSALADVTDFSISTNYQDLPFTATPLLRLVPLGDCLIAYFGDAVYMGTPTNNPLIPLQFQRVETGGVGLVGPKAVISWLGAHFFVGQDDIYMLTTSGVQRIGSPVLRETLKKAVKLEYIRVQADPQRYRILFGFAEADDYVAKVYSYEYRAKAWSFDDIQTYMMANPIVTSTVSWDGLAGNTWDNLNVKYSAWDSMKGGSVARSVYFEGAGKIWQADDDQPLDKASVVIVPQFITKDYDFEMPDTQKIVTGFNIKVDCKGSVLPAGDNPLQIKVEVSTNRGASWKNGGTLRIAPNQDEGWVSFRAIGTTFRFRCTVVGTPPAAQYTFTEHGMRVRLSGAELSYGAHKA